MLEASVMTKTIIIMMIMIVMIMRNLVDRLNVGRLEGNNSFRGASFPSVPPTNLKGKSFHPYCPKGKTNHSKQI